MRKGIVYIVGGGPGDPELLTLKALSRLQKADVVVYDALVNPRLLKHVPKKALKIFAGKRRRRHAYEQEEIHPLLVKFAREGKTVCRLKGGDPFLFGRGGEEAEFLAREGVPFEIVPGVSSVNAVPAAAGIPLTHRDHASSVAIVTGHLRPDSASRKRAWPRYASDKTLVILMGFSKLDAIVRDLVALGWPKTCKIAVIASGTLPSQKVATGTLSDINARIQKSRIPKSAPALLVLGEVVSLRGKIFKGK